MFRWVRDGQGHPRYSSPNSRITGANGKASYFISEDVNRRQISRRVAHESQILTAHRHSELILIDLPQ